MSVKLDLTGRSMVVAAKRSLFLLFAYPACSQLPNSNSLKTSFSLYPVLLNLCFTEKSIFMRGSGDLSSYLIFKVFLCASIPAVALHALHIGPLLLLELVLKLSHFPTGVDPWGVPVGWGVGVSAVPQNCFWEDHPLVPLRTLSIPGTL